MMKTKEEVIVELNSLKKEGELVKNHQTCFMSVSYLTGGYFDAWRNKVLGFIYTLGEIPEEIIDSIKSLNHEHVNSVVSLQNQIDTIVSLVDNEYINVQRESEKGRNDCDYIERVFDRFHMIARQLRTRYSNRETLKISDEYDVQDLLHALLLLYFNDVRAEEWTPSYAGGCVRMDFLLKDIQTVIEVKKTRESMSAKDLGEQLIIDIEKYKVHPDCKQLYCFVYDPEGLLGNPVGIKNDLESSHRGFLKVFIKPE